jgi:hypothetical protein
MTPSHYSKEPKEKTTSSREKISSDQLQKKKKPIFSKPVEILKEKETLKMFFNLIITKGKEEGKEFSF